MYLTTTKTSSSSLEIDQCRKTIQGENWRYEPAPGNRWFCVLNWQHGVCGRNTIVQRWDEISKWIQERGGEYSSRYELLTIPNSALEAFMVTWDFWITSSPPVRHFWFSEQHSQAILRHYDQLNYCTIDGQQQPQPYTECSEWPTPVSKWPDLTYLGTGIIIAG
jgi:hypothetical protein